MKRMMNEGMPLLSLHQNTCIAFKIIHHLISNPRDNRSPTPFLILFPMLFSILFLTGTEELQAFVSYLVDSYESSFLPEEAS